MIDSHCHLYSKDFDKDIQLVIENAVQQGVTSFYMPAIDQSTHADMIEVENKFKCCHSMMGLHPCSVKDNYKEELNIVSEWLIKRKFSAIGETGLDFYWDKTFIKEQYESLEQHIEWALQYNLPLVLHTRNAMQETIDVVKKNKNRGLKGIFHCFGGSLDEARQIIETGFYLGIGGVVTYKNGGLDKVLPHIDLQHIVLETDAPYLAPVPFRGKRNESSYLTIIAEKIAAIKQVPLDLVNKITSENATEIFTNS
ncbi:MAG: TatD family hydrolase [Bacteroidetes bacterium]|nr:TatD family hydrolase [Bacteroidota bacterium]